MSRNGRTFAVLVLAVALAGLATYGVYRAISSIPVREVEVANYKVVVAGKPLSVGALLTADDVKLVSWPARSPVVGGFTDVKDVVNRGLLVSVLENEPITASRLASIEAGGGLPPSIPTGMRAMSVKVNEVIGVAGFVVPGTRVDVLMTIRGATANDTMTRTVVSNVQVLTAGTRYDQEKAREGEPIPSTVVTLMVTPEDAERITLAQVQGQIMLALRNPLDTAMTDTPGIRTGALMGEPAPQPVVRRTPTGPRIVSRPPAPRPPASPPPPVNPVYTVEAIRAAKRSEEVVREEAVP